MSRIATVVRANANPKVVGTLSQIKANALKARFGKSGDPFELALTSFAKNAVRQRGLVLDRDLDLARKDGIDDASCWKSSPASR